MLLTRPIRALATMLVVAALTGCAVTITPPEPTPTNIEEDEDFGTATVYEVSATGELDPAPDDDARRVWDMFERVVTPLFAGATITTYRVGDSADSDTLAYVYRDRRPGLWNLAANLAYAEDDDLLLSTLVHEYGHILSLNEREVPPEGDDEDCDTLLLYEGCALPGAAIYRFQTQFWDRYGDDIPDPSGDDVIGFYQDHDEDFVSEYAATSVEEDFAETFMTFVLEDRPDDSAPLAAKFAFFYDLPGYERIRDRIRSEFDL